MECEPISARIIDDIKDFERIVKVVHDANGIVVRGLALRSGKRYKRLDGKGDLKRKAQKSQRKSTLQGRPVHNDAWRGYSELIADDVDEIFDVLADEHIEFENEAEEHFGYLEDGLQDEADVNMALEDEAMES